MHRRPLTLPLVLTLTLTVTVTFSFVLRRVFNFVLRCVLDEEPIAFTFEFEFRKLEQDGERVGLGGEGGEDVV